MPAELLPFSGPEHRPFLMGEGARGYFLIHGFPGTPAEMRPLAEALAENGSQVRAMLLPGFGPDIIHLEDYGRKDWLQAVQAEWLSFRQEHETNVLCGYSMGGALALAVAAAAPPDKMVLIAPFWRLPGLIPKLIPYAKFVTPYFQPFKNADFQDTEVRAQFDRILPGIDLDDAATQEGIREQFKLPLKTIDEILRMGREAFKQAGGLSVPTLVVQGVQDPLVKPQETRRLVTRMDPDWVEYLEIQAGHDVIQNANSARPRLSDLILRFVDGAG